MRHPARCRGRRVAASLRDPGWDKDRDRAGHGSQEGEGCKRGRGSCRRREGGRGPQEAGLGYGP